VEPNPAKPTAPPQPFQTYWLWVLGLIGLDYFSTLSYQPSIAYQAAGLLAPVATVVVVLVTLFGALPVYAHVVGRSPNGQGSMGVFEQLLPGWRGKTLILTLLGFAATDFIFTRTFSAADAAVHLLGNPNPTWQRVLDYLFAAGDSVRPWSQHPVWVKVMSYWNKQMVATLLLLTLGFAFWYWFRRGFDRRVMQIAGVVVAVYLLLTGVITGSGLYYLSEHPTILTTWYTNVLQGQWHVAGAPLAGHGWAAVVLACLLLLPKMALGLSGFEMGMVVMPLIKGRADDDPVHQRGRVRNTRKLLVAAALIMSVYLLGSALVTATLIPAEAFGPNGTAVNRALAYLAHGGRLANGAGADPLSPWFGRAFGTLYDLSTILILSLAGLSVSIGLRDLVPPYLQRLGMELPWAQAVGAILYIFTLVKLVVTVVFRADVGAQRGAYATSVLVLMASAGVAAALHHRRQGSVRLSWPYTFIAGVFLVTAGAVIVTKPAGVGFAAGSILAILIVSMISRVLRSTELRFQGFQFVDDESRFLWQSLEFLEFPVLVPHHPGGRSLQAKEEAIRKRHRLTLDVPIVFLECHLGDPSEFFQQPLIEVKQEDGRFNIRITRCTSISHAIAAAALELSRVGAPPEIHFGWSDERPFVANLNFVLFGQGNIPWMVRELIRRAEPRPERQPRVIIG
jgi:hypothetical protein